jgi:acetylornithine deacetylase/succinyl-diaminopimelate desuccinylase-like protein
VDADRRTVHDASRSARGCADGVSGVSRWRSAGAVHEWRDVRRTIPGNLAREVVEFGPLNGSIHKIDEHVRIADLEPLSVITNEP